MAFEVRFGARDAEELRRMGEALDSLPHVPIREATFTRALEVQQRLAERGQHRAASLVDLLVAAAVEIHDLVVLHDDGDFDLIAAVTGQATEWVVPEGSIS